MRMLGVPVAGPSILLGDNKAVIDSSMIPSYRLKKHHNVLEFHRVREEVSADIVRLYHLPSNQNPADPLTNHRFSRVWYQLMRPMLAWSWRDGDDEVDEAGKANNTDPST